MTTTVVENKVVAELLNEFTTQPGCEQYTTPTAAISLLTDYLWVLRFAPTTTFESYLETTAAAGNAVHPLDVLKQHCPRVAKVATAAGKEQWTAKECAGVLEFYVDVLREPGAQDLANTTLTLNDFLTSEAAPFKAGAYAEPEVPKPAKAKAKIAAPVAVDARLSAVGQRVIYTVGATSQQLRGHIVRANTMDDRTYLDFESDAGALYAGCSVQNFEVCDDPAPEASTKPCQTATLTLPASTYSQCIGRLDSAVPGCDTFHMTSTVFEDGYTADVDICECARGAYVDARLYAPALDDGTLAEDARPVAELPPRYTLLGEYLFETPDCDYRLVVAAVPEEQS